jgi:tetratricopeptide (TPR) repeat protein
MKTDYKGLIITLVVMGAFVGMAFLGWSLIGNKLKARDQLRQGVQSFKSAQYTPAVENFKKALSLDPSLQVAQLYLATAYANQFIPGAESDDNMKMGQQAIDEFKAVLKADPSNVNSVAGIASLYFNMKKLDDAKEWYSKQIALDPKNSEAYYSIGVIDWTKAYPARMKARADAHMDPQANTPFKDKKAREALCSVNGPIIDDAFKNLNKSVEINPDYDDTMAYINLMYREKADCEESPEDRDKDLDAANTWVDKLMKVKAKKAAAAAATPTGGITQ